MNNLVVDILSPKEDKNSHIYNAFDHRSTPQAILMWNKATTFNP